MLWGWSRIEGAGGGGGGVVADAHVQPEAAQRGELGDEAADVGVALDGLRAAACGVAAAGVQTGGQGGDLLVEGVGDGGEVAFVGGDVRRVSLVGEVIGEGEDAGCLGGHGDSVRPHRGLAARPPTSYNLRRGGVSGRNLVAWRLPDRRCASQWLAPTLVVNDALDIDRPDGHGLRVVTGSILV